METRLNYALLGIFFVVTLIALSGFIFWAGKYNRNLNAYNQYYLYNKELPKGIRIETPVRYLGLPVGFVESYALDSEQNQVEIILWIKKDIVLKQGTQAMIESQGLTGGNYIAIIQGDGMPLDTTEKLVLEFKKNWIEKVGDKTEAVFDRLEVSMGRFNQLLSDENLKNIESILANIQTASSRFDSVLGNLDQALIDMHDGILGLQKSRALIHDTFSRGDYNLRAIFTPLVYDLEQNSKVLERVLLNTENVIENFSQSPSGFLFGTENPPLGPREK